jgi:hypothetical protein
MLEAVMVVAADRLPRLRPSSKTAEELRAARSCYDHLAGRLGVALAEALGARGFIIMEPEGAEVTPQGMNFLSELGLEIDLAPKSRRPFCRPCLDWSERRYHVAGRFGALLLRFCLDRRWLERRGDSRAPQITELGTRQFAEVFQIEQTPSLIAWAGSMIRNPSARGEQRKIWFWILEDASMRIQIVGTIKTTEEEFSKGATATTRSASAARLCNQ